MSVLTAVLLGLVQGVAEFLPISSSGHLAIAEHLLNMQGAASVPDFYDVLLHLGTLVAVFIAYWEDIRDMVVEFFAGIGDLAHHSTPNPVPPARRLILMIVIGTLPLFVMVPFRHFFTGLGDNMYFIGGALIVTGILLFASDRVRRGRKTEKTATMLDALLVAPCTGSTLAKLARGVTDTAVTMACKAHLRNGAPLILAISTNDGLSGSAESIAALLQRKNVYFVPFRQDAPHQKPFSLQSDFDLLGETIKAAMEGRQLQPVLL